MNEPTRRFARNDEGQVIVLVAIMFLTLVFAIALVVNTGLLFVERRAAQGAADAAALSGALQLTSNPGLAMTAATDAARLNGYTGSGVVVNVPPKSGPNKNNSKYIEVLITTTRSTFLAPEWGITTVNTRAVAGSGGPASQAVFALDKRNTPDALQVSSQGSLTMYGPNGPPAGGTAQVNSSSALAAENKGTILPASSSLYVTGNYTGSWPNPNPGAKVVPNPYDGFPKPPLGPAQSSTCCVMQPGTYTSSWGNGNYVLNPGIYVFKGGGIDIAGGSSLCTGLTCTPPTAVGGIMLFFTHSNYPLRPIGSCASMSLSGGGTSTLKPATTGTWAGMLIYQDPDCSSTLKVGGNGSVTTLTGLVYLPSGHVSMNGQNASLNASQLIAQTIQLQNGNIIIDVSTAAVGVLGTTRLVE